MTSGTEDEGPHPSAFRVVRAQSITEAAEHITPKARRFVLLLAMDASAVSNRVLLEGAEQLLMCGAAYICAWGPDCERVHDSFDRVIVDKKLDCADERQVIMTTWHTNEPLKETVWFFRYCAHPAEAYAPDCTYWIALTIGNDAWADQIEEEISERN